MGGDLDISLLRTFVAIVETGGFTLAARKVGRTQPAITHQVGRLEERLGRTLFARDRRRIELTAEGEILLEYARAMLRLSNEACDRLSSASMAGHVTLGTPDLYAAFMLPDVLGSFARGHPDVEIELRCTRSVHLREALERGELDIALVTDQPEFKHGQVICKEPVVWVAGPHGDPERNERLPLALLPQGSVYRQLALEALGSVGRSWAIRSICDSIAGLQATVFAGLAVSVFPHCAVVPALRQLERSDGLPPLPPVTLVMHRRSGGVSEAAEHFAQYIVRELASRGL